MAKYKEARTIVERCENLRSLWSGRDRKIVEWYDILALYDKLKQEDMESVVANDPRTFYNTALHLLTPNIPHRIPVQGLDREGMAWASSLEGLIRGTWAELDQQYRRRARKSWMEYVVGLLLATGWYAVLVMAAKDKLVAEAWNPIEVYPDWDDEGLLAVAHVFTVSGPRAMGLFKKRGWPIPSTGVLDNVTIWDLWEVTEDGVINATATGGQELKPETVEPFEQIPVLVGPAGGLPDDGPISAKRPTAVSDDWRSHAGESILATNAGVYDSHNRISTFMQQILRDVAQPKYWEKTRGNAPILTPESLNKRGPIFQMGEGDDVGTIQMPGIPIELSALIQSYEAQIQRGALPHALSGQVENIPIGLMSQVAAAASQVLSLYHRCVMGLLTDIDNIWIKGVHDKVYVPGSITPPSEVSLETLQFDISFPISIPGDLVQRATILRMVSPSARLAASTGLDMFFPEIHDPARELAQARTDDAQTHPVFTNLNLISALREEAEMLRKTGNTQDAELLDKAAQAVEAQIAAMGDGSPDGRAAGGVPPNGMPPNEQAMLRRLGAGVEGQQA